MTLARNDEASIGEPVIVKVNFSTTNTTATGSMASICQTADGRWLGASVLCTATVNKMGILDSRGRLIASSSASKATAVSISTSYI